MALTCVSDGSVFSLLVQISWISAAVLSLCVFEKETDAVVRRVWEGLTDNWLYRFASFETLFIVVLFLFYMYVARLLEAIPWYYRNFVGRGGGTKMSAPLPWQSVFWKYATNYGYAFVLLDFITEKRYGHVPLWRYEERAAKRAEECASLFSGGRPSVLRLMCGRFHTERLLPASGDSGGSPLALTLFWETVAMLILYDFLFFIAHWAMHSVPFLWHWIHKFHHLNQEGMKDYSDSLRSKKKKKMQNEGDSCPPSVFTVERVSGRQSFTKTVSDAAACSPSSDCESPESSSSSSSSASSPFLEVMETIRLTPGERLTLVLLGNESARIVGSHPLSRNVFTMLLIYLLVANHSGHSGGLFAYNTLVPFGRYFLHGPLAHARHHLKDFNSNIQPFLSWADALRESLPQLCFSTTLTLAKRQHSEAELLGGCGRERVGGETSGDHEVQKRRPNVGSGTKGVKCA
uniref:Fatty acid hydroxylase domain-containing protein n=1 Tax=Chromera velia CCMP2878 TaxID=1169474 RepID=A0A0G4HPU2_9ALVE|eukprot:Cvel_7877.t1-p1 / transcript=Cvel_7877.t1 / gene=Cvel_7877 / organism=Chromera_velia_CCMP2878 / gene_product=hypothetical protein / transcript_product=hypothetical protein / location=Cvel_scaffold422:54341-56726(+) / protein_length=460 / sequence_SO=supercontig / SO=protein_coding / is_pseudo=false